MQPELKPRERCSPDLGQHSIHTRLLHMSGGSSGSIKGPSGTRSRSMLTSSTVKEHGERRPETRSSPRARNGLMQLCPRCSLHSECLDSHGECSWLGGASAGTQGVSSLSIAGVQTGSELIGRAVALVQEMIKTSRIARPFRIPRKGATAREGYAQASEPHAAFEPFLPHSSDEVAGTELPI